jgi:Uma2 family endonuclease
MENPDVALTIPDHYGDWTVADYLSLPESKARIELQEGCLVVSPQPTRLHQLVANRLMYTLQAQLRSGFTVGDAQEVALADTTLRVPDLFIAHADLYLTGSGPLRPEELTVVVEVVSPSSRRTDRLVKPAEYAAAGIPGFWRVELDPEIRLSAYVLGTEGYDELGTWGPGETARINAPASVAIRMDDLL